LFHQAMSTIPQRISAIEEVFGEHFQGPWKTRVSKLEESLLGNVSVADLGARLTALEIAAGLSPAVTCTIAVTQSVPTKSADLKFTELAKSICKRGPGGRWIVDFMGEHVAKAAWHISKHRSLSEDGRHAALKAAQSVVCSRYDSALAMMLHRWRLGRAGHSVQGVGGLAQVVGGFMCFTPAAPAGIVIAGVGTAVGTTSSIGTKLVDSVQARMVADLMQEFFAPDHGHDLIMAIYHLHCMNQCGIQHTVATAMEWVDAMVSLYSAKRADLGSSSHEAVTQIQRSVDGIVVAVAEGYASELAKAADHLNRARARSGIPSDISLLDFSMQVGAAVMGTAGFFTADWGEMLSHFYSADKVARGEEMMRQGGCMSILSGAINCLEAVLGMMKDNAIYKDSKEQADACKLQLNNTMDTLNELIEPVKYFVKPVDELIEL